MNYHAPQRGLWDALRGIPALGALVSDRIWDAPPADLEFPFVGIGEDTFVDASTPCGDACEITSLIRVYSRKPGFVQAKQIAGAIADALKDEDDLTIDGHRVAMLKLVSVSFERDGDGLMSVATLTYRLLVEQA